MWYLSTLSFAIFLLTTTSPLGSLPRSAFSVSGGRFPKPARVLDIEGFEIDKICDYRWKPLYGTIDISGAKNAAVAIIPAALLVDGVCRIENIPQISDVTLILNILQDLGAEVRTVNRTTVDIDCSHVRNQPVPHQLARKIAPAIT